MSHNLSLPWLCLPTSDLSLDQDTYYFEFLEKAFDGKCVSTIKVGLISGCEGGR